jgi:hypothetical protein
MNTLVVAWADGTFPATVALGKITEADVRLHIRTIAGADAIITRVSDRHWRTAYLDPGLSGHERLFILSEAPAVAR